MVSLLLLQKTPFNDQGLRPVFADICASSLDEILGMGFTDGPSIELKAVKWPLASH